MRRVRVQSEPFDYGAEAAATDPGDGKAGALVSFCGVVRDLPEGGLIAMEIEHYPGMTQKALEEIAAEAEARWDLAAVTIIHRFGRLAPGAPIMMVATASAHRRAAFEAADFLMDYLKSRAPFWKKEHTAGGASWVAAKSEDEDDLARWT